MQLPIDQMAFAIILQNLHPYNWGQSGDRADVFECFDVWSFFYVWSFVINVLSITALSKTMRPQLNTTQSGGQHLGMQMFGGEI